MRYMHPRGLFLALFASDACAPGAVPVTTSTPSSAAAVSVRSLALIRTQPGVQAEYLRGIAANWAGARRLAREKSAVRSYRALASVPDTTRGWDVVLLTEYTDSAACARREATFAAIFKDLRYVAGAYTSPRSTAQLRTFAAGDVRLSAVAGSVP